MVKKGDVYYADFEPGIGSEQAGRRPIVVIQNDIGNKHSPTTIVAMITSKHKKPLPTHVTVSENVSGLPFESTVMLEQIRTVDKRRLGDQVGHLNDETMKQIDIAAQISLDIKNET